MMERQSESSPHLERTTRHPERSTRHPERSEGSPAAWWRSLAALGMTGVWRMTWRMACVFSALLFILLLFMSFFYQPYDKKTQVMKVVNQIKVQRVQPVNPLKSFVLAPSFSYPERPIRRSPFMPSMASKNAIATQFPDETTQAPQKKHALKSEMIVLHDAKATVLAALIKDNNTALLSKRGTVVADRRTNSLWIQDSEDKLNTIRALVDQLDSPVRQVLIESKIVDVTQDVVQDLGIRFGVTHPSLGSQALVAHESDSATPIADRLTLDLPVHPAFGQAASLGIALAKLGDNILLDLELSALESEGRAEVMASPRLMTANQQEALIEAGQDIPYQQSLVSGATSVAFKKAVLSLRVTPQMTPDGRVLMRLKINQDRPSTQLYNGVPAIITKEIDTNVLVRSGQTIVLGGIYQRNKGNNVVRVPFFGKLPYVGALFRRTSVIEKNEELLIFITPRVVTEADEDAK
ncbi:MAG: type IV pilus secretin PilQ [Gammaproteobacteria bacterium]|nr:type IV pilus secretin PilQ [Gammaproteobacteria bacterium]